jgi:hypothetical protein
MERFQTLQRKLESRAVKPLIGVAVSPLLPTLGAVDDR